jgi:hypothetical protein
MTRGRKPLIALDQAEEIGRKRGLVLPTPGKREDYFDLVLCENQLTVFVRIKRSITHLSDPRDILAMYRREIIRLRKVPLTPVISRELWVRSPRGSWQFFRILADRIVEIRQDGSVIIGADHLLDVLVPTFKIAPETVNPLPAVAVSVNQNPPAETPVGGAGILEVEK